MKKLIYLIVIIFLLPVLSGCENFLDTKSYTTKDENSFPVNEKDANQMLVGVYAILNVENAQAINGYLLISELASDDRFGGGGENDKSFQAISHLMRADVNQFDGFWKDRYTGISRATSAISALSTMPEGDLKNQKIGEAKVLRAYFYFDLVQIFGDIPLILELPTEVEQAKQSPPQAPAEDVFKAIATDLWSAYSTMPAVKFGASNMPVSGTVTKWAAAGLLARVYLFYTGFYGKTSMPMTDGELTNAQVVAALEDCINNSGHALMPDFRSLWPYSNKITKKDYPFAADAPDWAEGKNNPEPIFYIQMNAKGDWGTTVGYSNSAALFFGIRDQSTNYKNLFPMGQGWGAGPVNSNLWYAWPANDPRRQASIYNQAVEATGYTWGNDSQMEETGMWEKKIVATTAYGKGGDPNALYKSFWSDPAFGNLAGDDFQLGHGSSLIVLRFADILLMHSELTKTVTGINKVRARANASIKGGSDLAPVAAYSDQALRDERRWEFAFEGLRWGDIRRWGIAGDALNNIYGVEIRDRGVITTMKPVGPGVKARYEATKGFFNKPQTQLDLANGALQQNPGWGSEAVFNGLNQ